MERFCVIYATKEFIAPERSNTSMMLPTRIAKPKVFKIQPFESKVTKRESTPSRAVKKEKLCSINIPKNIAPKSESKTLRV